MRKWTTIVIGALVLGLGAEFLLLLAFGGPPYLGFAAVGLAVAYWFYRRSQAGASGTDLWVTIFRGLAIEAGLLPLARLTEGLLNPQTVPAGYSLSSLVIAFALVGVFLAAVFMFNARLLNTQIRLMRARLEEERKGRQR